MTVLVLRAHYTMDVFTGAVAARYATLLASRIAPRCDNFLRRLMGQTATDQETQLSESLLDAPEPDSVEKNSDVAKSPQ